MSLMQRIKTEQLEARKKKDVIKASLLTTLIGEATAIGKNDGNRETTDAEVVAMVKKFLKNIEETMKVADTFQAREEKLILIDLLPTQLSEQELKTTVWLLGTEVGATTSKDMGKIMKVLKERYDGQYDGALASKLIKEMLGS
jgi:uncharacterized protein YqeY